MSKPSIYVTRKIPKIGLELLSRYCDITLHKGAEPPDHEKILSNIQGKDGLLCMLTDKIDAEIMKTSSELKVISSFSVGVDHIDTIQATKMGIYVTCTPGVLTNATADLAFGLMISAARRIAEGDRNIRNNTWRGGWSPNMLLGEGVYGKTLGIIGLGRIGCALAERASGFKMKILYNNRNRSKSKEKKLNVEYRSLEDLLKESDFISLHVPLTKETHHLIDCQKLKKMKRNAVLVNTSRGQIIDENDLADTLEKGEISGAGIDVFSSEPLSANSRLSQLNNVVLTPHIGSATHHSRNLMAEISARNLLGVLKGENPQYLVNTEVIRVRSLDSIKMI